MTNRAPIRPRVVAGLRLVRLVGRGGEGEVWEARTSRGAVRALKLVRPDALVEPAEVERRGRWLREVDHPALVEVLRTGLLAGGGLEGWAYVEMPFLDGPSLHDASADPEALDRLDELADALDLLHAGVWSDGVPLVHRDVKPANLIDLGDRLVLVDHSTLRDASAETITRVGTPVFAAPEVALGRAGPAADIYAFAATAVALVTGARGRALAGLLDDPEALDIPGGLRAALAHDPRVRPPSCGAALDPDTIVLPADRGTDGWLDDGTAEVGEWAGDDQADRRGVDADDEAEWRDVVADDEAGWTDVLLGDEAGADEPDDRGTRPVWRWLAVLALLVCAPLGGVVLNLAVWPDLALLAAAVVVGHLVAHGLAGGPPVMRVLAPPLAWAWLLADRAGGTPRRRAYARAVLTGALGGMAGGVAWALVNLPDPAAALAVAGAGLLLAAAGVRAARAGGAALQLLVLPLWVVGAVALAAGAVLLLPFALAAGRARATARVAGLSLASLTEVLRRPS